MQPGPVDADVREVLRQARQLSEWTEGTFDVTFGALTDVWKFDHDQDNSIPAEGGDLSRGCRSSITAGSRSTIAPAPCSWRARG